MATTAYDADFKVKPHISKHKRALYVISYIIISMAIAFILLIAFWMLFPYDTVEVETPIDILNEDAQVAPGEPIEMRLVVDKDTNLAPSSTQFILCSDGSLTFVDPGNPRNLPPGNYEVVSDSNLLPAKIIPGSRCTYQFRNSYKVNPIRSVTKEWASEQFLVVRR